MRAKLPESVKHAARSALWTLAYVYLPNLPDLLNHYAPVSWLSAILRFESDCQVSWWLDLGSQIALLLAIWEVIQLLIAVDQERYKYKKKWEDFWRAAPDDLRRLATSMPFISAAIPAYWSWTPEQMDKEIAARAACCNPAVANECAWGQIMEEAGDGSPVSASPTTRITAMHG